MNNPITAEIDIILNWNSNPIKINSKENSEIITTISLGLFSSFGQNLENVISNDPSNDLKIGNDNKLYIHTQTTLTQSDW